MLFSKKNKKTKEEIQKEREETVAKTSTALKLQIATLNKKKEVVLKKVVEAKQKGLKEQENQARNLLKQTLAAMKREEGMLMTLELAIESRDLAQLNMNFLNSIGTLSEDIISSGKQTSAGKAKKIGDKYLRAVYESNKQKDRIKKAYMSGVVELNDFEEDLKVINEKLDNLNKELEEKNKNKNYKSYSVEKVMVDRDIESIFNDSRFRLICLKSVSVYSEQEKCGRLRRCKYQVCVERQLGNTDQQGEQGSVRRSE